MKKKIIRPEGPAKKIILLRFGPKKIFWPGPKTQAPPLNIKWTVPYHNTCTRYRYRSMELLEAWKQFVCPVHSVQRCLRYNNRIEKQLDEGNNKPFWKYIKAKRQDNIGVAGIKHEGVLHQDSKMKAELLNKQFQSVFTKENESEPLPPIKERAYPSMPEIVIKTDGVEKLLRNLSPHKASGPDSLPNTILKNCATELAPVISDIFRQSLDSGSLPSDWRNANISPVFNQSTEVLTLLCMAEDFQMEGQTDF